MGWQDRDWAKWTDEERARFYGGAPAPHPRAVTLPTLIFGTGVTEVMRTGDQVTCTALMTDVRGITTCQAWAILMDGQHAAQAQPLPAGTRCASAEADQHSGRWVCLQMLAPAVSQ